MLLMHCHFPLHQGGNFEFSQGINTQQPTLFNSFVGYLGTGRWHGWTFSPSEVGHKCWCNTMPEKHWQFSLQGIKPRLVALDECANALLSCVSSPMQWMLMLRRTMNIRETYPLIFVALEHSSGNWVSVERVKVKVPRITIVTLTCATHLFPTLLVTKMAVPLLCSRRVLQGSHCSCGRNSTFGCGGWKSSTQWRVSLGVCEKSTVSLACGAGGCACMPF